MMKFRFLVVGLLTFTLLSLGSTSAGSSAPAKPKGEPIRLMVLGLFSGAGYDFDDVPNAAKAAAAALNKKNGINGRPVEIIVCDTQLDPNKPAECARQAVEENVTAVVGAFTISEEYLPILEEAGIPSVASYGISFSELTGANSYPIGATASGGMAGMGALLADQGADKVDVAFIDIPGGTNDVAAGFADYGLEARGAPKATKTPVPSGGADLTPTVQQTIDEQPEGIALAMSDPEFSKWLLAYRQAGGDSKIVALGATVNPTNIETLGDAADGLFVAANFKPASLAKSDPGVRQMVREIRAFDKDIRLVDPSIQAWAGVHLVADALEGQPESDAATLTSQLNQDRVWDTRVGPPINFAEQPPEIAEAGGLLATLTRVFTTDIYYAKVKNGRVVAIDGDEHDYLAR